ncbi:hypothetical protein AGMMS50256_30400 [Betaproteobacteria bacterium]|nr:hypothetical protein AGMMS50256_30400 [Betaproteobacteria bacterium]
MVLMGYALRELPLIVQAWKNAAQRGLGPDDGTAELREIFYFPHFLSLDQAVSIYNPENKRLTEVPLLPVICPPIKPISDLTLNFISPLRLQDNGRALPPERLTPTVLLMAAVRRVAVITQLYGTDAPPWDFTALARQSRLIQDDKTLHWQDWTRRSARQQRTMQMGGVVGQWRLSGDLTPFFPALHFGQCLHLGKETVFGLGRYTLTVHE